LVALGFFIAVLVAPRPAAAIDAAIVVDANSDTVVTQLNPDRLLHPASMSKLMTLYLTFEALEAGRITLQRTLPVSAHAASMSPTKLNLIAGETIRVEDAILSLVTLSANDSAVTLGEALGGSEDRFGQLMTRKAHQLGMVNTNFRNASGLPDPAQISTARDMAILCRALIHRFPQYYHYFSTREFTYNGIEHANHNHLMSRYEGMDGLKTGLTNASGFNLAASAVRNGRRLIAVVFGGTSALQRDNFMADLLDEGFRRVDGVAMTTAPLPPVPERKPSEAAPAQGPQPVLSAAAGAQPGSLVRPMPLPVDPGPLPGPGAPVARSAGPAGVAGEGDIEAPDDARPAPRHSLTAHVVASLPVPAAQGWSIQVGAFATRKATEQALRQAVQKAPGLLRHATAVVSPLAEGRRTMYRGRLAGLEAGEARKACRLLPHCLTVPPSGAS
jgi:D-alanyl-D-alanine carboxypeptidase